jgi:hypothetical protein
MAVFAIQKCLSKKGLGLESRRSSWNITIRTGLNNPTIGRRRGVDMYVDRRMYSNGDLCPVNKNRRGDVVHLVDEAADLIT